MPIQGRGRRLFLARFDFELDFEGDAGIFLLTFTPTIEARQARILPFL